MQNSTYNIYSSTILKSLFYFGKFEKLSLGVFSFVNEKFLSKGFFSGSHGY